jgi:hypothetical protein
MLTTGYLLHLIIDGFSSRGVDWLYPLGQGTIKFDNGAKRTRGHFFYLYRTGFMSEYVLLVILFFLNITPSVYLVLKTLTNSKIGDFFNKFTNIIGL